MTYNRESREGIASFCAGFVTCALLVVAGLVALPEGHPQQPFIDRAEKVIHSVESTPAIRIVGPSEAEPGQLVKLSAEGQGKWAWGASHDNALLEKARDYDTAENESRLFFSTSKPGSYVFWLAGADSLVPHVLVVRGSDPVPPSPPGPIPPDPPGPLPPPVPSAIRVLVIEETLDRVKPVMAPWVRGGVIPPPLEVVDYLNAHCAKNDRGLPEWRWLDDDADLRNENQKWRDAMALPRASLPWIVICNGTACESVPLPQTKAELLALLRKWGG